MTGVGTLNGAPIGPALPPSVPCGTCQTPTWVAIDVVAVQGEELVGVSEVMERDLFHPSVTDPLDPMPWALSRHTCREAAP